MQAIELYAQVTENREIHLKLPDDAIHGKVKVIVMYESNAPEATIKKRQFGQFKGKVEISDDFDAALPDSFWTGES